MRCTCIRPYLDKARGNGQRPVSRAAAIGYHGIGQSSEGRRLGRFDRYLLSQVMRVFGFFALVLVGVYWVNRSVLLLDRYLSQGQAGGLVLELTLLSLPSIMTIVLPVAAFVASAYATNRLHADSELVVVQATGFSVFRLARPFLLFGLLVGGLMLLLTNLLVPASMVELNQREDQLAEAMSARLIVPGTFQSPARGVTVYVRDVTAEGELQGLLVADRRNPASETTYSARSALLVQDPEGPKLIMFDGMAQTLEREGARLSVTAFEDFTIAIGSLITPPGPGRLDWRELPTAELLAPSAATVEETRRSADVLRREGHERLTQPLMAVGAAVLGYAALMVGGFSRFGLWRQIALAVLLIVLVKLVDNAALDLAARGPAQLPVAYAAPALSAVICVALLAVGNSGFRLRRRSAAPA